MEIIIEKERIDGYEHRASKKRKPSIDNTDSPGKCLLAMSDDSSCESEIYKYKNYIELLALYN